MISLLMLFIIICIVAYKSIKIVRESEVYIIERLGSFHQVAETGITIVVPFLDKIRSVVSLKQQIIDISLQNVVTSDNVTITIDAVVFYQITDPVKAVYKIQSLKKGIESLVIITIRDVVGKMKLNETFRSKDQINNRLRVILDEATDPWGCKIDRVEIKDITLPTDIRLDEATDSLGCKINKVEIKDITPPTDIRDVNEDEEQSPITYF